MDEDTKSNQAKSQDKNRQGSAAAANVIRTKLNRIFSYEPNAQEELEEVKSFDKTRLSKHQEFMDRLSKSGRSLAEIQTAWHEYYQQLPDDEKHQVWREFYAAHEKKKKKPAEDRQIQKNQVSSSKTRPKTQPHPVYSSPVKKVADPKKDLLTKIARRSAKNKRNAHAHSLIFGLGLGTLVMFIMMFTFFNERFITPFIRPSVNVSATPIIVDPNDNGPVSADPKIIIPKINVEAPVVYDEPSIEEEAIQKALERGVVHYSITPVPGELGNSVIVGHSSSNILNSGKYKFAFLLLKSLENGDTFIVNYNKTRYVYKVYNKFVTNPQDISVLNPPKDGKKAIMTLITCDPPGLSTNRLIIQAEQIFPNPNDNKQPSVDAQAETKPEELGGNAPSLWSRLVDGIF